jgi:hypothetical protein
MKPEFNKGKGDGGSKASRTFRPRTDSEDICALALVDYIHCVSVALN